MICLQLLMKLILNYKIAFLRFSKHGVIQIAMKEFNNEIF